LANDNFLPADVIYVMIDNSTQDMRHITLYNWLSWTSIWFAYVGLPVISRLRLDCIPGRGNASY
jgi:hypothetical protein